MWLGIPFLFVKERLADTISIDKIPTISVDSSFSWETIFAAFLSGLVPAIISIYVIRENNKAVKYQQEREDKRNANTHLRVILSDYAYQLSKVFNLYRVWASSENTGYSFNNQSIQEMKDALSGLNRYRISLLISIPNNSGGMVFRSEVTAIYDTLENLIKKHKPQTKELERWGDDFEEYITKSNGYLESLIN
jgi:hypothetical protein